MDQLETILDKLTGLLPTGATIVLAVAVILAVRYVLTKRFAGSPGHQFRLQLIILILSFVGLLAVVLTLPVSESTVGQLLSLLGLLLSAAIALSATTFVGNIMAGLMLRAVRNFRLGDFVRVGEYFGRVSERGLFHVEIQTEDRDLTTMPNLYLVTNPVKVIRSSGTLITADVSLGYDVPRADVDRSLMAAAQEAGLQEPFVHILNLGDFSVTYRIAGLLPEVKSLLSTRSRLREMMLDRLHEAGIEIVSPTFMNQRVMTPDRRFIPKPSPVAPAEPETKELPEAVVFDKAEEAESLGRLQQRLQDLREELNNLKTALDAASDEAERQALETKSQQTKTRIERLSAYIVEREKEEK
ncbi:MAG TPA: mechanosensitive ion channel domain-containing protein [Acidobacteriota bacterium]|nr:mechanosensitive ion channel domain-containing protein [Acidobacteriota bacterium]